MKENSRSSLKRNLKLIAAFVVLLPFLLASCSNNPIGAASYSEPATTIARAEAAVKNAADGKISAGNGFADPEAAATELVNAVAEKDRPRIQELVSNSMWIDSPDDYQISDYLSKALNNVNLSFLKYKSETAAIKGYYKVILSYKTKDIIEISIKEEKGGFYVENIDKALEIPQDSVSNPPSAMTDKVSSSRPDEERIKQDLTGETFYYSPGLKWIIDSSEFSEFKIISRNDKDPDYETVIAEMTLKNAENTINGQLRIIYTTSGSGWLFSRIQKVGDFKQESPSEVEKSDLGSESYIQRTISKEDGNVFLLEVKKGQQLKIVSEGKFRIWLGGDKYGELYESGTHFITADGDGGWYFNVPDGRTEIMIYKN